MFDLSIGIVEIVLRATLVYAVLFLLLRFGGKKHVGELAPFDLVVLLILSETVQGALIADDKSLVGGLIAAATLIALGHVVGYLSWRSKQMERFFEGTPRFLVRNGRVLKETLAKEQVTHSELIEALRREGCTSLKKVRFAVLENDGTITVGMRLARASKGGQAD
jgi:uncharacterized membrane protein YcaP (DUF421 family)